MNLPRIPAVVLWAAVGAIALYVSPLFPSDPPLSYSEVVVPARVIEDAEPDTIVRWRERIVTRIVEPDQVATAEEPAGEPEVASFCADFARARVDSALADQPENMTGNMTDTVETVSTRPGPRRLLLRSGSHDAGWFFRSDHLTLTGPTSHGELRQSTYTLRPGFSFRASGDSVIVRSPRFWWAREAIEFGVPVALTWLACHAFGC